MIYLLEYSEEARQYHYNYLDNSEVRFQSPLFSNGWKPICIVDEDLYMDSKFDQLQNNLRDKGKSYEEIYTLINTWVINRMEGRKLPVK